MAPSARSTLLVVSPKGLFLVEIKSWPGVVRGDAGTWQRTLPGRTRERSDDNPLLLTNRKAKRLKSLLGRQPALRAQQLPFIQPACLPLSPRARLPARSERPRARHRPGQGRRRQLDPAGRACRASSTFSHVSRPRSTQHSDVAASTSRWPSGSPRPSSRPASGRRSARAKLPTSISASCSTKAPVIRTSRRSTRGPNMPIAVCGSTAPPTQDPAQRKQITRAAQREFELLAPVQHPGIVHALDLHEHELGPALVFERDPTEIRLDQYLDQRGAQLNLFDRLALLRDLAETVASAHGRRLAHRALSPRSILVVRPDTPRQRFCIINWQTGARDSGDVLDDGAGYRARRAARRRRHGALSGTRGADSR